MAWPHVGWPSPVGPLWPGSVGIYPSRLYVPDVKWRCTWCGREYDADDPPCETCGRETFEPVEGDEADSAFEAESFVWVCENCGREHVKNPKICARCSHPSLAKRPANETDLSEELSTPGYLSVGWPYVLGAVAVIAVVVLALTGVLPVPGVGGPPAPPEAPGEATQAAGLELETVEAATLERFDAERGAERGRDQGLNELVTYLVRHEVATAYDPEYDEELPDLRAFDPNCGTELGGDVIELGLSPAAFDDEAALGDAIAAALLEDPGFEAVITGDAGVEAVTVHATPDDTLTVGYAAC